MNIRNQFSSSLSFNGIKRFKLAAGEAGEEQAERLKAISEKNNQNGMSFLTMRTRYAIYVLDGDDAKNINDASDKYIQNTKKLEIIIKKPPAIELTENILKQLENGTMLDALV